MRRLPDDSEQKNWCAMKDLLATRDWDLKYLTNPSRRVLFAPAKNLAQIELFSAVIEL
jgi:hypothetical protein